MANVFEVNTLDKVLISHLYTPSVNKCNITREPKMLPLSASFQRLNTTRKLSRQLKSTMNNTESDGGFAFEHISVRIVRLVLYPVVFIIGVIGNVTVCVLIFGAKSKKFSSAKGYSYFILNLLALSDLLVLFLFLPFDLAYLKNHSIWPFGFVLCKVINTMSSVSVTVSGSMLIHIGYERYKTIVLAKTLARRLSKRKAQSPSGGIQLGLLMPAYSVHNAKPQLQKGFKEDVL